MLRIKKVYISLWNWIIFHAKGGPGAHDLVMYIFPGRAFGNVARNSTLFTCQAGFFFWDSARNRCANVDTVRAHKGAPVPWWMRSFCSKFSQLQVSIFFFARLSINPPFNLSLRSNSNSFIHPWGSAFWGFHTAAHCFTFFSLFIPSSIKSTSIDEYVCMYVCTLDVGSEI